MNYMDKLSAIINEEKNKKVELYLEFIRSQFVKDVDKIAKIYTQVKVDSKYRVVKLKSGEFALIDLDENVLYKNVNVHLCKVEFIMAQWLLSSTFAMITSKL